LTFYKIKTDLMYPEAHSQIIIAQSKWSERTWNLVQNSISSSHQFIRTSFHAAIYSLAWPSTLLSFLL